MPGFNVADTVVRVLRWVNLVGPSHPTVTAKTEASAQTKA